MGMGYLPYWMMYQCLMATFLFYLAHWQTYVTGKLEITFFTRVLTYLLPGVCIYALEHLEDFC